jgi:hypothetical protein
LTFTFAQLDTKEWFPSADELLAPVQQPPVLQYLNSLRKRVQKQVLVLTDVKVGYGVRAETKAAHAIEGKLEVAIDPGIAGGAPGMVTIGPKFGHGTQTGTDVGWETATDGEDDQGFLFAYKVQRVAVKKTKNGSNKGKQSVSRHVEYTSGAVLGTKAPEADEPDGLEIDKVGAGQTDETGVLVEAGDGSESLRFVKA